MEKEKIFVGIDWGHEKHHVCAIDADGTVLFEKVVKHTPDGLNGLCDTLIEMAGGVLSQLAVSIERPNGIVVETLLDRGIPVYALNPKQLDRFRDRFSMSGAKDDRRDARALADSVRTDRRAFRKLEPDHDLILQIREASRTHTEIQQDLRRQANRLREQLLRYYPQFLEAVKEPDENFALALWKVIPTPQIASKTRKPTFQRILKQHRIRRIDADQLVAIFEKPPMTVAPGTQTAVVEHIRLLNERVALLNSQLAQCDKRIEALLQEYAAVEQPGEDGEQPVVTIALALSKGG